MKIKIIDDDIQFMDSLKNTLTGEFIIYVGLK